jgi:hypothetical protein
MFARTATLVVFLVTATFLPHSPATAEPSYVVKGETKGYFCSFYFFCRFQKLDGLSFSDGVVHALPYSYKEVSDFRSGKDGAPGKCWVTTRADESRWGWLARFWDWWADVPVFYTKSATGELSKLGSPEFIVFDCEAVPVR